MLILNIQSINQSISHAAGDAPYVSLKPCPHWRQSATIVASVDRASRNESQARTPFVKSVYSV